MINALIYLFKNAARKRKFHVIVTENEPYLGVCYLFYASYILILNSANVVVSTSEVEILLFL
jgi:hypothetical protein